MVQQAPPNGPMQPPFLKYLDWRLTLIFSVTITAVTGNVYTHPSQLPTAFLYFASCVALSGAVSYVWQNFVQAQKPTETTPNSIKAVVDRAADKPLMNSEAALLFIKSRRAIYPRDFNGQPATRQEIEQILEAANWAPSHGQTEPWRFVVLSGSAKEQLIELTIAECGSKLPPEKAAATVEKLQKKKGKDLKMISHYIAICMKREAKVGKLKPEWEEMAAVSSAVQNMWLMSTAVGVAGYWTSWQEVARDSQAMHDFLGLDDPRDRCLGFFVLGKVDEERRAGYRASRGPVAEKVVWKE